jgi:putative ABC transport system substrate-binding protein
MRRRDLLVLLASTPMSRAFSQVGDRIRKLAVLLPLPESDPEFQANVHTLKQALHRHGWIEGRNIELSVRSAGSGSEKIRDAARATLAEQPDVILARSTAVVLGVKQEVTRIPVVFIQVSDPVGQNIVQSLAHPGGNLTGSTNLEPDLGGKWLEILKEIDPSIQKVALLSNMDTSPISGDILQR